MRMSWDHPGRLMDPVCVTHVVLLGQPGWEPERRCEVKAVLSHRGATCGVLN